jgi:ATP-dependent helicase/DNAse subunit B
VLKELAFVLSTPGLNIAGQIDLLLRDAEGAWRIVDYKSDRLEGQNLADHAGRYGLQMQLYMDAAGRHLANCGQQGPLADAALYFLRTGQCWRIPASEASGLSERLAHLAGQISACRRSGLYPAIHEGRCSFCPYSRLCR